MNGDLNYHDHALRRELRELDPFSRDWFRLTAMATVKALAEGRGSTISTNAPEIAKAALLDLAQKAESWKSPHAANAHDRSRGRAKAD